ncbi:MAG: hypothetical protein KAR64_04055, partial [Thermoplasmatales archaeon]|nr:hypothetical protein [Thermoplasmatales archaeon]
MMPENPNLTIAKGMEITKEEAKKLNTELDDMMDSKPSPEEQEAFRKKLYILKNPALITLTIDEIHKEVVGETDTILTLININSVRLVKNAQPTSGNALLNSKTRAGKDHVANNTYEVTMNKAGYIHRSKVSKTAFNYWHNGEEDWNWDGKQLLLEDIESEVINSPVFKTMSSGSNKATITIKNKAVDLDVKGKPNITCTAYDVDLNQEALGRYAIIHIDESEEQTRAIKKFMSKKAQGTTITTPDLNLRSALEGLQRVEIVIPYADSIVNLFPDTVLMRDIYGRFLDYIKANTAFHQDQREKDDRGRLIATYDDYFIARITLMKTYSNVQMIPTTLRDEKVIKFIGEHSPAPVKEIMEGAGVGMWYCYDGGGLDKLEENGLIRGEMMFSEEANRKIMHYLLPRGTGRVSLPLFPEGIPVDEDIKKYIKKMIRDFSEPKNLKSKLKTDTRYNTV